MAIPLFTDLMARRRRIGFIFTSRAKTGKGREICELPQAVRPSNNALVWSDNVFGECHRRPSLNASNLELKTPVIAAPRSVNNTK